MKKMILLLCSVAFLLSCNENSKEGTDNEKDTSAQSDSSSSKPKTRDEIIADSVAKTLEKLK